MATGPIETHLHRSFNWENGAPGARMGPRGRSASCGNGLSAQRVRLRSEINRHEMGDELLRRTASVLLRVAGTDCLPMRVGGDEFLLVCPHTDGESALGLEQDLRLGLATVSDEALTVSASIGVATVESAGNTLADVYRIADHNMYREKRMVHTQGADC